MPFSYYSRLTLQQKCIYQRSNEVLLDTSQLSELSRFQEPLEKSLKNGQLGLIQSLYQRFLIALCLLYRVPTPKLIILEVRPSSSRGELHGLYQRFPSGPSQISLWMRTAKKSKIVSFKTFLRTFFHEYLHHLDYAHFKLKDSFHTEGFYQRESLLMKTFLSN